MSVSGQERASQCGERLHSYYNMIGRCQIFFGFLTLNDFAAQTPPMAVHATIFLHQPG
jgi:hypothetical protein